MTSFKKFSLAFVLVAGAALASIAANAQGFGGNASISASTSSAQVAVPLPLNKAQYPSVIIAPAFGTVVEVFYQMGTSGSVTAVANTSASMPSGGICLNLGANTNIAAVTATGTANVRITQISGCTQFSGGR